MAPADLLNLDQPPGELDDLYGGRDYYHYLRSPAFRAAFHRPLAGWVNDVGLPCLDAGCGEAVLADYLTVPYAGLDGSASAIARAGARLAALPGGPPPGASLHVGRLEDPPALGRFGTLVLSGVLEVLVRPDGRVPLVELYRRRFGVSWLAVCDLERLDTSALEERYRLVRLAHAAADGPDGIEEVKRRRKLLLFDLTRGAAP